MQMSFVDRSLKYSMFGGMLFKPSFHPVGECSIPLEKPLCGTFKLLIILVISRIYLMWNKDEEEKFAMAKLLFLLRYSNCRSEQLFLFNFIFNAERSLGLHRNICSTE